MSSGEFDLRSRLQRLDHGEQAFEEHISCSRAGCEADARYRIEWRNPRIHSADRVKIWLACDEHLDFLLGFLANRDFPLRVRDIGDAVDAGPLA